MGTPEFAATSLEAILNANFDVVGVVTQKDKAQGRGLKTVFSPVKSLAVEKGLKLFQPQRARDPEFVNEIRELNPDIIVTAAYGQIIDEALLSIPNLGCINIHASLLPKYRGASPIQHALLDGAKETGITIFYMDKGVDTGEVIIEAALPIELDDDYGVLHDKLKLLASRTIVSTLTRFRNGKIVSYPQDHSIASHCGKLVKSGAKIDWLTSSLEVVNKIRAFSPKPGAFAFLGNDLIKFYKAQASEQYVDVKPGTVLKADSVEGLIVSCGSGSIRILKLQKAGGKIMSDIEFLRGYSITPLNTLFI